MLGLTKPRDVAPYGTKSGGVWPWGGWSDAMARLMGLPQPSGVPNVADWSVMGIPAAWRCATLVADSIASLPMFAYTQSPDGEQARVVPTPDMLVDPWPMLGYHNWIFGAVWSLLLRGDAFALPADFDPANGFPRQWVLLNPDEVWVELDVNTQLPVYDIDGMQLGPGEVMHIRGITPPGSVRGIGVIEAHRRGFATLLAMDSYGADAYTNSGVPSGVVTVDRPELGQTQADDLKARWVSAFGGKREPAVVPRSITFTPLAFSPTDMAYIEARKLGATEVCWMFGVHPQKIGAPSGTSMTYMNVEATNSAFVNDSLIGWTGRIEDVMSKWMPRQLLARFNFDGLLRGTTLERMQAHDIAGRIGIETLNEGRDAEHRPRFDDPEADVPTPLRQQPAPPAIEPPKTADGQPSAPLALVPGGASA